MSGTISEARVDVVYSQHLCFNAFTIDSKCDNLKIATVNKI